MIDRLEELLEQVEEDDEAAETLPLRRGVSLPRTQEGQTPADEAEETAAGGTDSGGTSRRQENAGRESVFSPFGELTYKASVSGLEMLRRSLRRTLESGSARGGSVAVVRETISPPAAGLTAGELDRAVRRDSRRYDGGMTIY